MPLSIEQLEFCRSLAGEALLVAPLPTDRLAAVTALRKICDGPQAAAVMEVRDIRRRAAESGKFPSEWAARLLGTDLLLQQASSIRIAVYVGRRLAAAGADPVWDLCCGLGANTIGLAAGGAVVEAFDRSPQAVLCATHNARAAHVADLCTITVADVTTLDLSREAMVHIDPDRRPNGGRTVSLADCEPSAGFLAALPQITRAGAMKLSPALPIDEIAAWSNIQIEYVSEDSTCKQLLIWWGIDLPSPRQATLVFGDATDPQSISLPAGVAQRSVVAGPGEYILEPDPAVIAAGATDDLAALLSDRGTPAWRIASGLDWLSASDPVDTPFARCFRILHTAAGRERDIAATITELHGGIVEIKPRGLRLDTDALQRRLRGDGDRPLAVLWCKLGSRQQAFITERLDSPPH